MTITLPQGSRVRINEEYLKGYSHIPPDDVDPLPGKTGTVQGPSTLPFFYRVVMDEPKKGTLYELFLAAELEPF
jgi:hypothetical protein